MKILLNADDFGFTKGVNEAVFELASKGVLASTTVMVNMAYAGAVADLNRFPALRVGLHLNMTQGSPVLPPNQVSSLVDADGHFPGSREIQRRARRRELMDDEIFAEMEAQYARLVELVGRPISHLDSHQGLNRLPVVTRQVRRFVKRYPIRSIRWYVKYYAVGDGPSARIERPGFRTIHKYGARRLCVEWFLLFHRSQMRRYVTCPDGILLNESGAALSLFHWLNRNAENSAVAKTKGIFEIPCHPAATTVELHETRYTMERVNEFYCLRSLLGQGSWAYSIICKQ